MDSKLNNQLNFLQELISQLQEKNIQSHKIDVLNAFKRKDEQLLRRLLSYVYDYDKTYGTTSKNVEKNNNLSLVDVKQYDDLFDLLNDLITRRITGHSAIKTILKNNNQAKTLYFIINKDLKSQISTKIINKVLPGCIKEFNVALANKIQDQKQELDFDKGEWIFERKIDGCRLICTMDKSGNIHFTSRQGREFFTLENLKADCKKMLIAAKQKWNKPFVLDGECCMINPDGTDNFSGVMQEITMKNHTIENPKYVLFDLISEEEFFQTEPAVEKYINRLNNLEQLTQEVTPEKLSVVENVKNTNKKVFEQWQNRVKEENWEGLCIRLRDSVFQAKRTNDLIKVKSFFDEEFIVKDVEIGSMKMLINGKMKEMTCVKSLVIEDESGLQFNCGSGLSQEQRIEYLHHPEKIVGKIITVQFFEKTVDQKTEIPSLRFPTLKNVFTTEQIKNGKRMI